MEDTSKIFKSLRGVTKFKSKNGKHTIKEIRNSLIRFDHLRIPD